MRIKQVICAPALTGFYFDDQRAIKAGAAQDGMMYVGDPMTPGFTTIRQAGEAISVLLVLEDGQIAWGDCAAVQYSGAGGRDPLFLAKDCIPLIQGEVADPCVHGISERPRTAFRKRVTHAVRSKRLKRPQ